MSNSIRKIKHNGAILAIIIPRDYHKPGITFCTPDSLSQQLAYMEHPAGHIIDAHVHNTVKREIKYTKETLILRKGRLRADFYMDDKSYVGSCILRAGDVLLLTRGGHGFYVMEDVELIEVKQGPYAGAEDKTRFTGVGESDVRMFAED